jgi:Putative Ig domain
MRQAQTAAAVLSMLDSSGLFSQNYVQVIQTFQIGNMLPALFDYSANQTTIVSYMQSVLQQIAAAYLNNSDPAIAQAAAEAQALAQSKQLGELIATVQGVAAANAGKLGWSEIAPLMQNKILAIAGKIGSSLVILSLSGIGLMSIISGVKDWSELSTTQRTQLIASAADFVIQSSAAIIKRGAAIGTVWDSNITTWDNIKGLFKSDYLKTADETLQNGFKKWLVSSGNAEAPQSDMFGNLFSEEADVEEGLVTKIFGRNLDEFVSTRLGAAFAVINLVISAINLAEAKGSLDIAGNALMVASASLELIATAGAWALGAAGVTEIGGLAVATICSCLGVLAVVAAIAGIVILLVLAFKKQPTPVESFGQNQASAAGFYMPHNSAIDYFTGYVNSGGLLRLGVALMIPASASVALAANPAANVSTKNVDYSYDTVLMSNTNAFGQTAFTTVLNVNNTLTAMVLTANDDNTVSFQVPAAPGSPGAARQLWVCTLMGDPAMDGSHPQSGPFTVQLNGTANYLHFVNDSVFVGPLSGTVDNLFPQMTIYWTIVQEPMAPGGLSMADIALYTFSGGQTFTPALQQVGSKPKTWSITPALPAFLSFDTSTGKISQVPGVSPPVTPTTTYTLSVKNDVSGAPVTTTFTITVSVFT